MLQDIDPHKLDLEYLKSHRVTGQWVQKTYGISRSTLKNYRRGFYFRGGKRFYYKQLDNGEVFSLEHIPQVQGEPIYYTVSSINEWLRLIGQEELIPEELQSL